MVSGSLIAMACSILFLVTAIIFVIVEATATDEIQVVSYFPTNTSVETREII
jgi:hypothetical protein